MGINIGSKARRNNLRLDWSGGRGLLVLCSPELPADHTKPQGPGRNHRLRRTRRLGTSAGPAPSDAPISLEFDAIITLVD